ncbi:MAG: sodium-solute symporter, putative [uncultured Propionibacteriaceae bacterium]|uniref:Sodium-solute symporter, putative n=1 Tax=uncultured Propionibacteriaceae bacterium TaxID=257457 RepID=A0A6J4NXK6_9ACTN|nr:MAG: sodium-solute symporter, putative [uncultured Propionibacteriaceae bacterium]
MIIFGVSLTVLVVLVVGIGVARKIDGDSVNYLVAGRRLGVPLVAVSLTAAAVDSNATVGNTDLTAAFGFWSGASLAIGLAICLLLAGIFLAKPMNAMKLFTLGDYFRARYDRKVEIIASVIMIFAFTILLAGNLVACGFLMERFAGIPYSAGVIIAVTLVLTYTIAGGLYSDAYTAAIQTTITLLATVSLLVWVALRFGIAIPKGMGPFDLGQLTDSSQGAPINWATLISLGIGDLVAIDFMQRIFGAKSPEVARKACFFGAAGTLVIGTVFALVALTASSVLGLTPDNGPVLYQLLGDYAPPLLAILVLSGIVAASFSTASGAILATSAVAVRNVLQVRRISSDVSDPLLRYTRMAMVPVVIIGVVLAIRVSQTGILLTLAFDLMLACLAAPFLLGVFWQRPGVTAALAGIVAGLVVRVTLLVLTPTLYGVPNDLLYLQNPVFGPVFDGWATMVAAMVGFGTYAAVGASRARPEAERESERTKLDLLTREAAVEREPAVV